MPSRSAPRRSRVDGKRSMTVRPPDRRLSKRDVETLLATFDDDPVAALEIALRRLCGRPGAGFDELVALLAGSGRVSAGRAKACSRPVTSTRSTSWRPSSTKRADCPHRLSVVDRRTLLKRLGLGGAGALGASLPVGTYFAGFHNGEHRLSGAYTASVSAGERQGHVRLWWSVDAGRAAEPTKMIALTFDDGPTRQFTSKVLNILADHNVPASFFLIGELVRRHPDLVRRMLEEGHEVGNHTFDHFSCRNPVARRGPATVERGANAIASISGERPRWFRPVRGHVTGALMQAVADAGHEMAMWSVSRGDAAADDDVEAVLENYITDDPRRRRRHLPRRHRPVGMGTDRARRPVGHAANEPRSRRCPRSSTGHLADGYELVTISSLIDRVTRIARRPDSQSSPGSHRADHRLRGHDPAVEARLGGQEAVAVGPQQLHHLERRALVPRRRDRATSDPHRSDRSVRTRSAGRCRTAPSARRRAGSRCRRASRSATQVDQAAMRRPASARTRRPRGSRRPPGSRSCTRSRHRAGRYRAGPRTGSSAQPVVSIIHSIFSA